MTAENVFPKIPGDILYASEVNQFNDDTQDATTSNKGIASFNSADFNVSAGAVSLRSKGSFWSTPGAAFMPNDSSADAHNRTTAGILEVNSSAQFIAPVELPQGVVVTSAVVRGSDSGETWQLTRREIELTGAQQIMASNSFDNEDSTILNATIDNEVYCYFFSTSILDSSDVIKGARIAYTTDYN